MIDLSKTIDLSTTYLGLKLKNPLVASASPMCEDVGNIRRMEDAGAVGGGAALAVRRADRTSRATSWTASSRTAAESRPKSLTHFPELTSGVIGPEAYLEHIREVQSRR